MRESNRFVFRLEMVDVPDRLEQSSEAVFSKSCNALQDKRPATELPKTLVNNTDFGLQNLGLDLRIHIRNTYFKRAPLLIIRRNEIRESLALGKEGPRPKNEKSGAQRLANISATNECLETEWGCNERRHI